MLFNNLSDELQGLMDCHGHLCFGVLMGYKACKYAGEILELTGDTPDSILAVTENAGCGNDAVKFLFACREYNGSLICRKGNRQSWSFFDRVEEEGVTLTVNPALQSLLPKDKDQAMLALLEMPGGRIFNVEPFNLSE